MSDSTIPSSLSPPLLEVRALAKRFESVRALNGVDFTLRSHEVHALMGENGAGKSTLIKCLSGVHQPDGGAILLGGTPIAPSSPRDAESRGISTVFQEVNLIPHLSVAENICLGREPTRRFPFPSIRWSRVRERARAAVARLGLELDVSRGLASCSIAVQQLVAIARALDVDARVLILDEPTSSLDQDEVAQLFTILRRLRDQGMGIIFIAHFLDQVYAIADRITVLRDGALVGVHNATDLSRDRLVSLMVGRAFETIAPHAPGAAPVGSAPVAAKPFLRATGLARRGSLEHVDLEVAPGEAVGLVGLLGSGRSETARALFGADRPDHGAISIDDQPVVLRNPRHAIARGIALTPENRRADGIIPNLSVRENIILALQARRGLASPISRAEQADIADRFIRALNIKTPSAETPVSRLSGGNQQKALLARWLVTEPRLLILDEPTRGIDVAAKAEILRVIDDLRSRGMAILLISSELDEVVRVCRRLVVLRDRRSVARLEGEHCSPERVLAAIAQHHAT